MTWRSAVWSAAVLERAALQSANMYSNSHELLRCGGV